MSAICQILTFVWLVVGGYYAGNGHAIVAFCCALVALLPCFLVGYLEGRSDEAKLNPTNAKRVK